MNILLRAFSDDYYASAVQPPDLEIGSRIPEFAWDDSGRVAWGARLYGDSFVIAAEPEVVQRLHCDPRIDTISGSSELRRYAAERGRLASPYDARPSPRFHGRGR